MDASILAASLSDAGAGALLAVGACVLFGVFALVSEYFFRR